MRIFTKTIGEGKDVVLLHAWTHDHHSMQPIVDLLVKHYRVTLVDLPGAGQSDWDDSIDNVNDAADLLLPYLPEKAIYIGWSWGGFVGISLAARYPDRVERFIGIGTAPRLIEDVDWPGVPQPGFHAFMSAKTNDELKLLIVDFYKDEFGGEQNAAYQQLLQNLEDHGLPMSLEVWSKGVLISDQTDLREEYKTIKSPIDFIIGTSDQATALDWDKVKALNPKTKVHFIEGAKHAFIWTHPKEFVQVLNNILEH